MDSHVLDLAWKLVHKMVDYQRSGSPKLAATLRQEFQNELSQIPMFTLVQLTWAYPNSLFQKEILEELKRRGVTP